jgi:hypothetical protein
MNLLLTRFPSQHETTIGKLYVDGGFECYILEDQVRPATAPKIYGKTAIPAGRYRVVLTMSPRFKRILPLLEKVPGYEGVRIHTGNRADDTEGCLLPGLDVSADWMSVGRSMLAFNALFAKLDMASRRREEVWLTILDPASWQSAGRSGSKAVA